MSAVLNVKFGAVLIAVMLSGGICAPAKGQLIEENVLLLWNSQDAESTAIKTEYLRVHPDVVNFDLNINYSEWPPNSTTNPDCTLGCDCPTIAHGPDPDHYPDMAINKYYVTPNMYEEFIREPLLAFLAAYPTSLPGGVIPPPILAFATTRGLPVAISRSFDQIESHNSGCLVGSVESWLARLGYGSRTLFNPYYGYMGKPFSQFIEEAPPCYPMSYEGKIFLVSRLDSADRDGDGSCVDDVVALIGRSVNLAVNKFGITLVFDVNEDGALNNLCASYDRPVAKYMQDRRWCVYFNDDDTFLHGYNTLNSPECGIVDSEIEGQYNEWPELVHATLGRNHRCDETEPTCCCSEYVCHNYIMEYVAHPAGFFDSWESYNGLGLRWPGFPGALGPDPNLGATHGSVLDWIAAGGSFTFGNVNGPATSDTMRATHTIPNLYEHGLSWGEAIWSGLRFLGKQAVPIGDPLARVIVYDPDVNEDGVVNEIDLAAVIAEELDINHDGEFDQDDVDLVDAVLGRSANALPAVPVNPNDPAVFAPPPQVLSNQCGDVDGDDVVDQADWDLVLEFAGHTNCPLLDVNRDGIIDAVDLGIVTANLGRCLGDLTGPGGPPDGVIDTEDLQEFMDYWLIIGNVCEGNPSYSSYYDVNCDECVNTLDRTVILNNFGPCN